MLLDFAMPGDGLGNFRGGILIPVVFATVADENSATGFDFVD
jgi:hypothetical protein